jgi:hypothetical protein
MAFLSQWKDYSVPFKMRCKFHASIRETANSQQFKDIKPPYEITYFRTLNINKSVPTTHTDKIFHCTSHP